MTEKVVEQYEKACEAIREIMVEKYLEYDDSHWVGSEIGGVLYFGDHFLNLDQIVMMLKLDLTDDEFFDWYWWQVDWCTENEDTPPLNMKNFIRFYREGGMEHIENFLKNHQ